MTEHLWLLPIERISLMNIFVRLLLDFRLEACLLYKRSKQQQPSDQSDREFSRTGAQPEPCK